MSTTGSTPVSKIEVTCLDHKQAPQFDHILTEGTATEQFSCPNCGAVITIQKETPKVSGGRRVLLSLLAIPLLISACLSLLAFVSIGNKDQNATITLGMFIASAASLIFLGTVSSRLDMLHIVTTGKARMRVHIVDGDTGDRHNTDSLRFKHVLSSRYAKKEGGQASAPMAPVAEMNKCELCGQVRAGERLTPRQVAAMQPKNSGDMEKFMQAASLHGVATSIVTFNNPPGAADTPTWWVCSDCRSRYL